MVSFTIYANLKYFSSVKVATLEADSVPQVNFLSRSFSPKVWEGRICIYELCWAK